jgi:ribosome biogenesis GTPase / thiamine phosphate phosphatase
MLPHENYPPFAYFSPEIKKCNMSSISTGLVVKSTGSWFTVRDRDGSRVDCKLKGNFRVQGIRSTNPVAVGDLVDYHRDPGQDIGLIISIHERKNYIIRRSSNLSHESHVIAANLDQAVLVITLVMPRTSLEFVDRFLVTAEAYRVPVHLVFNKIDLYTPGLLEDMNTIAQIYEPIGYSCLPVSAKTGDGVEAFRDLLHNKLSLLSGNSGVGKSTLINQVEPGLDLKVGSISGYHQKGKHTTTFAELFELGGGGYIIDTPGIKGFGLVRMDKEEIYHFFPEIFKVATHCQYNNCTHVHEPGCAVKQALEEGAISESRYYSYLSILEDVDSGKYR